MKKTGPRGRDRPLGTRVGKRRKKGWGKNQKPIEEKQKSTMTEKERKVKSQNDKKESKRGVGATDRAKKEELRHQKKMLTCSQKDSWPRLQRHRGDPINSKEIGNFSGERVKSQQLAKRGGGQ